ncbi:hypothetical protein BHK98_05905 [Hornefia porci]|uniref:Thioredoxin domain-containing protein n=1 Tax=Hornefia porci TaxID=2652292 RepID=A0A1Q9JHM8_9FIRM|nr:hypothetical protein [Hornefia porci]OLR55637.1 hypothetical protein BHK98_05905 [Hornefia porci]
MRISFTKNEIIAVFLAIVLIKVGMYFYPIVEPYFAESSYVAITGSFETKSVMDLQEASKNPNDRNCYYIGRSNCIDCRESINNIRELYIDYEGDANNRMYYVKLKNEITDEERKYLDSISIDSIPTIVKFEKGQAVQFGYDEINSKQYKEKFKKFIESEERR